MTGFIQISFASQSFPRMNLALTVNTNVKSRVRFYMFDHFKALCFWAAFAGPGGLTSTNTNMTDAVKRGNFFFRLTYDSDVFRMTVTIKGMTENEERLQNERDI